MVGKNKTFLIGLTLLVILGCKNNDAPKHEDSINSGSATIFVDETVIPVVQDQVEIFETQNRATVSLVPRSEAELIQALANGSAGIAILSRKLNSEEQNLFRSKKIVPRVTKFATDAIALIANKNNKDTLIALDEVINFIKGKPSKIKGLVFDNPNSSTARYISELAHLKSFRKEGVYSFETNNQAIKYVAENDGMIGVVGLNWIQQPSSEMMQYVDKVNVLSVKGFSGENYIFPSQNDIAEGKYPLARDLYLVNCQGYAGLGMGFTSFIVGEIGQRIILKSGLVPVKIPGRKILIRNGIEKNKK